MTKNTTIEATPFATFGLAGVPGSAKSAPAREATECPSATPLFVPQLNITVDEPRGIPYVNALAFACGCRGSRYLGRDVAERVSVTWPCQRHHDLITPSHGKKEGPR